MNELNKKARENGSYLKWLRNNKDKVKGYTLYRNMNKKHDISKEEWSICKEYFNNSCAYCGLPIEEHYRLYRGKLTKSDLHKEHVDHNGSNDIFNCVPSCLKCNSSKHTSSLEEWYNAENKVFSNRRLVKINKWLKKDVFNIVLK